MCIFSRSEASGLQRLLFSKSYNVLKRESRFTLGLNAAKITDYIKKCFKQKFISTIFSAALSFKVNLLSCFSIL